MTENQMRINPTLAWRDIEGQVIVISPQDSVIHELNETASFIWKHIDLGNDADQIVRTLAADYDLSPEAARADAQEFLDSLFEKGLIHRAAMIAHA